MTPEEEKWLIDRELHHAEQYKLLIGGLLQIAEKVAGHLEGSDKEDMKQAISEFREKARTAGIEV